MYLSKAVKGNLKSSSTAKVRHYLCYVSTGHWRRCSVQTEVFPHILGKKKLVDVLLLYMNNTNQFAKKIYYKIINGEKMS